ncbi:DNA-binding transcriptional regulator, Lrp family [Nakamurella panacisegetis]|uniref:DNA-binding transcriptional regulator, Lrp family n=1 Tax=Nakamurella panacisegetis TaxID=1090615 RepID=A0A1H0R9V7_9ACTN|nr:Lrp/AsnC family transcriptional regulator [Nakamurella panacisegetis]SDP26230.1 DNA-binding transcriptional regulator, Lrp family [Nakamurella panacisegetis]
MRAWPTLDELDRRIIVALQQDGRASWTSIAEVCQSSVPTVARRAQQLIDEGVVRISVMPELGSSGPVESFIVRLGCRPGSQLDVAAALVQREEVRFLAVVTGPDDLVFELVVPKGASSYPRMIKEMQTIDGVQRWHSDLLLHVYKVAHDWSKQLLGDQGNDVPPREPADCQPSHLDSTDRQIIAELRDDGRAGFKVIAERLGLNESTVRRRFDRLQENGCVTVLTLIPAAALGLESETLMTVQVKPGAIGLVAAELARHRAVRYLAATLDGNALLCEVIATSTQSLFEFITTVLAKLDGVLGWSASMELLFLKRGFVETPWWRDQTDLVEPG